MNIGTEEDWAFQIPTSGKCGFGLVHGQFLPLSDVSVVVHLLKLAVNVRNHAEPKLAVNVRDCAETTKIKSDVLETPVILMPENKQNAVQPRRQGQAVFSRFHSLNARKRAVAKHPLRRQNLAILFVLHILTCLPPQSENRQMYSRGD